MLARAPCSARSAATLLTPDAAAILSTRSAFVMDPLPKHLQPAATAASPDPKREVDAL
jgi:hypothetical protein